MKKRQLLTLLFIICYLLFILSACSEPSTEEPEVGYFTISLSASENMRAVYPPTDISDLKFVAKFRNTASGAEQTYTSDGSGSIRGKIDVGSYIVTMDVSLISDSSPYARGIAYDNPVAIGSGQNQIKAYAYDVKNAIPPVISAKPQGRTYSYGDTAPALEVSASVNDGGVISYQWYSNTTNSTSGASAISGATSSSYMPSTATPGTVWHYVAVTNTSAGKPTTISTVPVAIVVGAKPDSGGNSTAFTDVNAFETWLKAQPTNTANTAYTVALNLNSLSNLRDVLRNASEIYVNLDLSGSTITAIPDNAFYRCDSLASVTIPGSVTSIGDYAFCRCMGLASITIPSSVTSIGDWAFFGCNSLTSITIPSSVTSIGNFAFNRCISLTAINVETANTEYSSQDGVLYNKNKTALCTYPAGKTASSVSIPGGVTSIGNSAFAGCTSFTSVTIPNSVTSIENSAFSECTGLASVTIPSGVTSIGDGVFTECTGLASVTILSGVTSIGIRAFFGCTGLTGITIPNSVTSIGRCAFFNCNGLTGITIPGSVTYIEAWVFAYCTNLTAINVEAANTEYSSQDGVLYNKNKTALHTYPIGKAGASFSIPDSVTSIWREAFSGCVSLTGITIPDSVTSIGAYAFEDCMSLTGIILPGSINSIEHYAFVNCTNLISVKFEGTIPSENFDYYDYDYAFYELGDLRDKFYATDKNNGTPGTYTTTAPVGHDSLWTLQP